MGRHSTPSVTLELSLGLKVLTKVTGPYSVGFRRLTSSFPDTKFAKYYIQHVLNADPTGNTTERLRRQPQILGREFYRGLRGEARKRLGAPLERGAMAGAGEERSIAGGEA